MSETLAYGYSSESSTRAFQWIPTWKGLDDFQKSLHPCVLDESSLSIAIGYHKLDCHTVVDNGFKASRTQKKNISLQEANKLPEFSLFKL